MLQETNKQLLSGLSTLTVYRKILETDVLRDLTELLHAGNMQSYQTAWAKMYASLINTGNTESLAQFIVDEISKSENTFSIRASKGERISKTLKGAVQRDLAILQKVGAFKANKSLQDEYFVDLPLWQSNAKSDVLTGNWADCVDALTTFHRNNGYGIFAQNKAFTWRGEKLLAVKQTNPIEYSELKEYEKERRQVMENTEHFLAGRPASNTLLYGDRGTGKSSTVHATLNAYAGKGLRMVEMPKEEIGSFPKLIELLAPLNLKFIVFIDDLSISADADGFGQLKAQLEGGLTARQDNMIIYATSNLRHLVRETFSSRAGDAVHATDIRHEQISLSDRFGLTVTFVNPTRKKFYTIIEGILDDRNISIPTDKLYKRAEIYVLERGGRSPRIAKQFVDLIESEMKLNETSD